jgi:hypothetical protein
MYAGQALLLIAFAGAGTEAMGHIYRTTLRQLLTREDLAMLAGQDGLTSDAAAHPPQQRNCPDAAGRYGASLPLS